MGSLKQTHLIHYSQFHDYFMFRHLKGHVYFKEPISDHSLNILNCISGSLSLTLTADYGEGRAKKKTHTLSYIYNFFF